MSRDIGEEAKAHSGLVIMTLPVIAQWHTVILEGISCPNDLHKTTFEFK